MRIAFRDALLELAARDERTVLLTADLGYSVLEPFAERFPDRFYNVGVAEQNMLGLATGLAEAGFMPFVYSIATFATMRPYEFVRNGPVLHELPVRIVGVGGGFDYGTNGMTHFALEDLALMRIQPGMAVFAPADDDQARAAVLATADVSGPAYLRIGRDGTLIPGLDGRFCVGRIEVVKEGGDVLIVATGSIAGEAVRAAELLADRNVGVAVAATLRPAPVEDLRRLLARVATVVTVEEHYVDGGLGSLVCEVAAEGSGARIVRCGVRDLVRTTGSQQFLRAEHGLAAESIAERVRAASR